MHGLGATDACGQNAARPPGEIDSQNLSIRTGQKRVVRPRVDQHDRLDPVLGAERPEHHASDGTIDRPEESRALSFEWEDYGRQETTSTSVSASGT